jgi:hypothetical protein
VSPFCKNVIQLGAGEACSRAAVNIRGAGYSVYLYFNSWSSQWFYIQQTKLHVRGSGYRLVVALRTVSSNYARVAAPVATKVCIVCRLSNICWVWLSVVRLALPFFYNLSLCDRSCGNTHIDCVRFRRWA